MVNRIGTVSSQIESSYIANSEIVDYETAIKLCGTGKFHYSFLLLCGAIFVCAAAQFGINAYILPSAECDFEMTSEDKGFLNVAFLFGAFMNGFVCGVLADLYGRKKVILWGLILDGIVTIASSLSQSYLAFVACRTINGFTISAAGALIFTYIGEFQVEKQRAKTICYIGFFWTLGWLVLPGLAWLIMSHPFTLGFGGFTFNSWRLFLAIIGLPTLLVALIGTAFPESPKFLLSQGKSEQALEILRKIYALNTGHSEFEYPVKKLILSHNRSSVANRKPKNPKDNYFRGWLRLIWKQHRTVFSPPLLNYILLMSSIYFMNSFGYYGLGLWLPELFNRFENYYVKYPNASVSVCELMKSDIMLDNRAPGSAYSCVNGIDEKVFFNSVVINSVTLAGFLIFGFVVDKVSRRTLPVTAMMLSSFCGFAIYFVRSSLQNLILSCVFSLTIATSNFCISNVVVDIFPTHVGAVAICMLNCFGRLGAIASNIVFGTLLDIACEVPIFLVAFVVLFAAILGFWIPPREKKFQN